MSAATEPGIDGTWRRPDATRGGFACNHGKFGRILAGTGETRRGSGTTLVRIGPTLARIGRSEGRIWTDLGEDRSIRGKDGTTLRKDQSILRKDRSIRRKDRTDLGEDRSIRRKDRSIRRKDQTNLRKDGPDPKGGRALTTQRAALVICTASPDRGPLRRCYSCFSSGGAHPSALLRARALSAVTLRGFA